MKGVLSGNLGESMRLKSSVGSLVAEKLPVTLQLAGMAFADRAAASASPPASSRR